MTLPLAPQGWDIEELTVDRTRAIAAFGFTERQARFLVTVMLHSGVFVERQYCGFLGTVHGQKSTDFLRRSSRDDAPPPRALARARNEPMTHRGPVIPPSFLMRQKWIAIRKPTASGKATTCST